MKHEFTLQMFNHRVVNRDVYLDAFKNLKDGQYLITIKDVRKRSLPQNSYYWGVMVPLIREALYYFGWDEIRTNMDAHNYIKSIHCIVEVINIQTGELRTREGSTAEYSISEFNDFVERVCKWAAEDLELVIPSPNQQMAIYDDWEKQIIDEVEE